MVVAHDLSDGTNIQDNHGATSSSSKTNKRAKIAEIEEDGLIGAFKSFGNNLVDAIKMMAKPENELPADLCDQLKSLPGLIRPIYHSTLPIWWPTLTLLKLYLLPTL